mgnify:CR=1 FL=1
MRDDLLKRILGRARDAELVIVYLGLDLELEVTDVLGDLLGALLVDALDHMADDAHGVA